MINVIFKDNGSVLTTNMISKSRNSAMKGVMLLGANDCLFIR